MGVCLHASIDAGLKLQSSLPRPLNSPLTLFCIWRIVFLWKYGFII